MLYNTLCVCLLVCCVIACTTDSSNEGDVNSIFPVPPAISDDEKETITPEIQVEVVNPPIPEPIVEPIEEPIVEEPEPEVEKEEVDQEPVKEPEEPKDETHPKFVDSTVWHGDIGVALDTNQFIFTFDEDIDAAIIRLVDITQGKRTNMDWKHFTRGKQVVLLKVAESLALSPGRAYTIEISVADEARNWHPDSIITFVTEIKE